jgi:3-hydroxybutyryl-CoA dehydratase
VNEYRWADLRAGLQHQFRAEVTSDLIDTFARVSGDISPLHCDAAFALANGYRDRVAHGMLTASLYSTLVGVHLPGKYALLHGLDVSFTSPVYAGDTLMVTGTIDFLSDAVRQMEISAEIRNQDAKRVSKARIRVGLLEG